MAPSQIHRHLVREGNIHSAPFTDHIRDSNIKMFGHLLLKLINSDPLLGFFPQNIPEKVGPPQGDSDLKAIFVVNDDMALGVVRAVQGTPDAIDALKQGLLAGTVAQYPDAMAYLASRRWSKPSTVKQCRKRSLTIKLIDPTPRGH